MKFRKIIFFVSLLFLFTLNVKANSISSIDMDIYIKENGDAFVTETWNTVANDSTEIYKSYYNLGESEIKNFNVYADGKAFKFVDKWDVDASFKEKAYKNGFNKVDNGVELCWGISKYGQMKYNVSYDITNFVVVTRDENQMVYWTLVPHNLSNKPGNVSIRIHSDSAYADDLDVWGFGNDKGLNYVENGVIKAFSNGKLDVDQHITLLVKFPAGTFNASTNVDNNFDYYLNMAKEGAYSYIGVDDDDEDDAFIITILIVYLVVSVVGIVLLVLFCIAKEKDGKVMFDDEKKCKEKYNLVPTTDLFKAYYLCKKLDLVRNDTNFLGVMLLKWEKDGVVHLEEKYNSKKKKKEKVIVLNERQFNNPSEEKLFNMLLKASGSNKILEPNELEKWTMYHTYQFEKTFSEIEKNIVKEMLENNELEEEISSKYLFKYRTYIPNTNTSELAKRLVGFKRYLNNLSDIEDKDYLDVRYFDYYMMYAQLFGFTRKVIEQLRELVPLTDEDEELFDEDGQFSTSYYLTRYHMYNFIHRYSNSVSSVMNNSSSGASSYSGGSGASSYGGGGGGSFGGGSSGGGGFR